MAIDGLCSEGHRARAGTPEKGIRPQELRSLLGLPVCAGTVETRWPGKSACQWEMETEEKQPLPETLLEKRELRRNIYLRSPLFLLANFYINIYVSCS